MGQTKKPANHRLTEEEMSKSMFFAYHQLRTPLISMKWMAEMLLKGEAGKLNPAQEDLIRDLYTSVNHANELVGHLLSAARIESEELLIRLEPVDLEKICNEAVKDLQPLANKKSQTLSFKKIVNLPIINTDPKYLREVLDNLLSNAAKYTPNKGAVELSVSLYKGEILFAVKDSGIGIPKAQQSRVFGKFFRGDNAVKMSNDGTGLGLYIVKNLVELLGGKIWFESEEERGTTFYFTLPVR
ncbi:MAG: HAMP domain-containing histidine kinase [Candidatus Harrisonbacteria bacterium]|nr:HAMP domain-containing histidine kinase [Candidatus Harrisonbacteria bacterium]